MHNFGTIYRYEIKKLVHRKLFWIMAFLCVIGIGIVSFAGLMGTYYVDGNPVESNYNAFCKDRAYRQAISGRYIDQALLRETVDGYSHVPTDVLRYSLTEEYETYARPYSMIFNLIRSWTGMDLSAVQNWEAEEGALYEARTKRLEDRWQSIPLSETEKEFWRTQESRMDTPFVYYYHEGYENILNSLQTVGILMLLFTAVCVSNLFADEHLRRTDQLVLSSIAGRKTAYQAKILAGVTVSGAAAAGMALLNIGLNLGYYGAEGFAVPVQVYDSMCSYPITVGQACLIAYGVLIAASVAAAVFAMVISEFFRSGTAALAVSAGLIILGNMVRIPTQYRAVSQIWDWSPMVYLSAKNVLDPRTLTLFGQCFASWQVVPVLYILVSLIFAIAGAYIYQRYQVSGR